MTSASVSAFVSGIGVIDLPCLIKTSKPGLNSFWSTAMQETLLMRLWLLNALNVPLDVVPSSNTYFGNLNLTAAPGSSLQRVTASIP